MSVMCVYLTWVSGCFCLCEWGHQLVSVCVLLCGIHLSMRVSVCLSVCRDECVRGCLCIWGEGGPPSWVSMWCEGPIVSGRASLSVGVCLGDFCPCILSLGALQMSQAPCLAGHTSPAPLLSSSRLSCPSSSISAAPFLGALSGPHVTVCARRPRKPVSRQRASHLAQSPG